MNLLVSGAKRVIKAPGGVLAAEPVPGFPREDGGMSEFRAKY
jgi:hypothetical protein